MGCTLFGLFWSLRLYDCLYIAAEDDTDMYNKEGGRDEIEQWLHDVQA